MYRKVKESENGPFYCIAVFPTLYCDAFLLNTVFFGDSFVSVAIAWFHLFSRLPHFPLYGCTMLGFVCGIVFIINPLLLDTSDILNIQRRKAASIERLVKREPASQLSQCRYVVYSTFPEIFLASLKTPISRGPLCYYSHFWSLQHWTQSQFQWHCGEIILKRVNIRDKKLEVKSQKLHDVITLTPHGDTF